MTKRLLILCVAGVLTLAAGTAMAESIKNRLGVTGRVGFMIPSDRGEVFAGTVGTNAEVTGGGGVIYGITDTIAGDLEITYANLGANDVTNMAFGVQYRFINLPITHLVPYLGTGFDVLFNGAKDGKVDDVVGAHLTGGADYFFTRDLAATAELKGVLAPNAAFTTGSGVNGSIDPTSFAMTFGVRYFFY